MPAKKNLPQLLPVDHYGLTDEDIKRADAEQALGMISPRSKVLNGVAHPIPSDTITTPKIQAIIARLMHVAGTQQTTEGAEKKRRMLVGLAAPQIGEPLRIIIVDTSITPDRKNPGKLECFINPVVVWRSRETEEGREGCFSAGPVWGVVRRSVAVKIRAYTLEGQPTERIFEGFTARIIQHECDHLDGTRFPDRIKNDKKRHWVHAEELEFYPDNIKHWPRICAQARWEEFKNPA